MTEGGSGISTVWGIVWSNNWSAWTVPAEAERAANTEEEGQGLLDRIAEEFHAKGWHQIHSEDHGRTLALGQYYGATTLRAHLVPLTPEVRAWLENPR